MATAAPRAFRDDDQPAPTRTRPLRAVEPRRGGAGRARPVPAATQVSAPARRPAENRRTVRITGHPTPARARRSAPRRQVVAQPDRVALWAFLLGLFLVLVAAATANAAVL